LQWGVASCINQDSQLEQLRAAGCSSRNIYREKATGARPDRRELNRMLGKLAPGDLVTVTRIDRLARSTFDLFGIVKRIVDAKAQFRSLANRGPIPARAAASLARLHHDQGRCAEARGLLAPVSDWFTEGFEAPDLKEAKALLEQLGSSPAQPS
jgi:hypothetical protein